MIVECPKCGAVNRIPDIAEPSQRYFCTECKTRLNYVPEPTIARRARNAILKVIPSQRSVYVPLLLIALVGIVSTLYHTYPYSDIATLYNIAVEPGLPYIDKLIEYPVLTGLFIHFAGVIGQSSWGYYFLSAFLLVSFAIVATYFLYRTIEERMNKRGVFIYWILAPSMFFFLVYNWDMIAVMFAVVALFCMSRDRDYLASVFIALGFCSKLFPVVFLLPLLLKRRRPSRWIKIIGIFSVITAAINVPFMLANFEGWYYFISFSSQRSPNPDSIWAVINSLVPQLSITYINVISFFLLAVSYIFVVWKYRHESTTKLCLILIILFLIFNKVFSPQFLLWLLPLYVLLPMKKRWLFYILELLNIIILFVIQGYYSSAPSQQGHLLVSSNIFVVLRHILLIYLLLDVLGLTSRFSRIWMAFRIRGAKSRYSDTVPLTANPQGISTQE